MVTQIDFLTFPSLFPSPVPSLFLSPAPFLFVFLFLVLVLVLVLVPFLFLFLFPFAFLFPFLSVSLFPFSALFLFPFLFLWLSPCPLIVFFQFSLQISLGSFPLSFHLYQQPQTSLSGSFSPLMGIFQVRQLFSFPLTCHVNGLVILNVGPQTLNEGLSSAPFQKSGK